MHPYILEGTRWETNSHQLLMAIGYVVGAIFAYRRWKALNGSPWVGVGFIATSGIASVVGSRALTVLENFGYFWEDVSRMPGLLGGGYGSWGGWSSGIGISIFFLWRSSFSIHRTLDVVVVPSGLLGQSVGRFGCLLSGDIYGSVTTLPWGITHSNPRSAVPDVFQDVPLHPVAVYMGLSCLVAYALSNYLNRSGGTPGRTWSGAMCFYSATYFLADYFRPDYRTSHLIQGISSPILCSLIGILMFGAIFSVLTLKQK